MGRATAEPTAAGAASPKDLGAWTRTPGEVAVLGAGVMGAAIAAHLANAGVRVLLLDIAAQDAPPGHARARNRVALEGLERARRARPAALLSPRLDTPGRGGNPGGGLDAAARCGGVLEAGIGE